MCTACLRARGAMVVSSERLVFGLSRLVPCGRYLGLMAVNTASRIAVVFWSDVLGPGYNGMVSMDSQRHGERSMFNRAIK